MNNVQHTQQILLNRLNNEILVCKRDGVIGIGNGPVTPRYIFIGQNPGSSLKQGERFFSHNKRGSGLLRSILLELNVLDDCYFTNIVHETTEKNGMPSDEMVTFWWPYLHIELQIIYAKKNIITMGRWAYEQMLRKGRNTYTIDHPAYIFRFKRKEVDNYKRHIKIILKEIDGGV